MGAGRWQVSWTSPQALPVRSDRPEIVDAAGVAIGVSTTRGRTVTAIAVSSVQPDPAQLGVVLSNARLDRTTPPVSRTTTREFVGQSVTETPMLDADPGKAGPYATVSSDYVRSSVKVAGMRQPIEMVGHVVEPVATAATGPRPLVVFLHGRHNYCYQAVEGDGGNGDWPCSGGMREVPSQLGYRYVQKTLASQGFTTVSIRVNGINAQDGELMDGGASARATIIAKHLDYWTTIAADHQVDLSRVVLVGHSRGGEGVDRAAIRIPLTAPYRIVGQVLVAPTDFARQTAPHVPTVTLLPYCDGDVSDLQGQDYTDISRDLSSGDNSLKSSVLVMGANHNFFNTEWTPGLSEAPSNDDWYGDPAAPCGKKNPDRLTAKGQRAVGLTYIAGAVSVFTRPATTSSLLPMFDGSRVSVRSAGSAVVHTHALGGDRDLRRPGQDTTLTLASGADSTFCTGVTSDDYRPDACGSELSGVITPHWPGIGGEPAATRQFWQVSWAARGQAAGLQLTAPLDLSGRVLDLRTVVDFRRGPAGINIRLTDTAGRSVVLTPDGGSTLTALPTSPRDSWDQVTKLWAQTVRVDPRSSTGVDLANIRDVEVVGTSTRGQLWIADLSSSAGTLPAVPAVRLPVLSIGSLTVQEGNAPGTTIARVPFRLSRPMDRPGRFRVLTVGQIPGSERALTIDLAPGQQTGTIPVGYQANRLDSPDRLTTMVLAGTSTNVITDRYLGELVVLDDDPSPKITITRVRTTVSEGSPAQWRVSLSHGTDYDVSVIATVVRGPGRNLTGADVPLSWLQRYTFVDDRKKTLAQLGVGLYVSVPAGGRSAVVSIPTLRDHVKEGTEAVTVRIAAYGLTAATRATSTSTIKVLDSQ